MIIYTDNHTYKYESEKICRIYYPAERIVFAADGGELPPDGRILYTELKENEKEVIFSAKGDIDGKKAFRDIKYIKDKEDSDSLRERYLAKAVTGVLTEITGFIPPWGILTGVRPAKLMRKYINTEGREKAEEIFTSFLQVTPEKTALAASVAEYENSCIALSGKNSYSLYISIPFCPTRCSYCSFVSHSIEKAKKLIPDYVKNLCEEIKITAETAKKTGLKLETVYMGGGTPTSFSAENLKIIFDALKRYFPMDNVREFTVEAGRPDTIDEEKLRVLKAAGVTRISINPQSFSDEVLVNIGRKHTAADTVEKFLLARKCGFDNINMDFIAGLPGDTVEGFIKSIDKAVELNPENITVHTLALKRSARLVTEEETDSITADTAAMVDYSMKKLKASGYTPYYMYRQSKCIGNLENVGWCKKGCPNLYNIYMMEEIHTVLAVGGAAVTKLVSPEDGSIERIYNFKYPYEYINRFNELIDRKNAIRDFYAML